MCRWVLALAITVSVSASAEMVCNVKTYGAVGNGKTKDTAAIQKAIDTCAKNGGVVRLADGTFLTGPILLKSHITLEVDKDATMLGSPDPEDYPSIDAVNNHTPQPLIYSLDAQDITIDGGGVIDGNGGPFWQMAKAIPGKVAGAHTRPRLIVFNRTHNIDMHDITVQNGASWQITPLESSDIDIHDIRVLAPSNSPNTDGIDPFCCHHVKISHVYISVGDDNVAVKSGMPGAVGYHEPSTDITVTNSEFGAGHGMSIGSEGAGGMEDVHVSHILMKGTENGIRIKSARDRGNKDMDRFYFNDIVMDNVKFPILVDHYYHHPSETRFPQNDSEKQPIGPLTPYYHDITISNVKARGAKIAAIIAALPETPLTSITLKNVDISADTGMRVMNATLTLENVDIHPKSGIPITVLTGGEIIGK
jgi:polygalacturonase